MSPPRPRYRLAIVGCGDIAEKGHLPAALAHERVELAAVCDLRAERAALLSHMAAGVPALTDYRELLGRRELDAVILALHPEVSVGVAIDFLRAGKAVLDEKPLATNLDDARRLVSVVEETRGVYQVGFVFRYGDLVRSVAAYATLIGAPAVYRVGVYDERLDPHDHEHYRRLTGILRHSSAVTHEGSHVVDYARLWHPTNPRPFARVRGRAIKTDASFPGPNVWSLQYEWDDGSLLNLDIGWLVPELPPSELHILGPNGALRLELVSGLGELRLGGQVERVEAGPLVQPWRRQLDAFVDAIDRGESTATPIRCGYEALAATRAAERAAATGQTVEIEM